MGLSSRLIRAAQPACLTIALDQNDLADSQSSMNRRVHGMKASER